MNQQYVSYVVATADREMVASRWRWHRRLIREMANRGIDWRALFEQDEITKGWRLIERPLLRSFVKGGLEWEIGEPVELEPKKPELTEAEAVARGLRGAQIGGVQSAAPVRRNVINGDVPPPTKSPPPHPASVGHRSPKIGRPVPIEQPPPLPPREPAMTLAEGVAAGTKSPPIGGAPVTPKVRRNVIAGDKS